MSTQNELRIKLLGTPAFPPTRNTPTDAGLDLYSSEDTIVPARNRKLIKTNIAIALPAGTVGLIRDRSSVASKSGITVGAGVIDEPYRGHVMILLFNNTDEDFTVSVGDKIAQMLIMPILTPTPVICDNLDETERGEKGFGSSGDRFGVFSIIKRGPNDEWLDAWKKMPPLPLEAITMPEEDIEVKFQEVKRQVIENAIEEYGKYDPTWKAWHDAKNAKPVVHQLPSIRLATDSLPKNIPEKELNAFGLYHPVQLLEEKKNSDFPEVDHDELEKALLGTGFRKAVERHE